MRIVIAEDEPLLREGLALVLTRAGFDIVASVGDAPRLVREVADLQPDLVVTDIRMPPGNADDGLRAAIEIRQSHPGVGVVVLSQHVVRRYALDLLGDRPTGVGYLLKHRIADIDAFCHDLQRVADGATVLDPEVVTVMLNRSTRTRGTVARLTTRQREVLGQVAQGRSNAAIATTLGISEKAVARHTSQIYDTLDLSPSPDDHRRVLAVIRHLSQPHD